MGRKLLACLVFVGFLLTPVTGQTTQPARQQSTAQATANAARVLPFEIVNRHIILKVKVDNSRPLSFVLDTGDKFAVIDIDRANELGLKLYGQVMMGGAGTSTSAGAFVRDSSFSVVGLDGFSQPVSLALPISKLGPRLGQDFDGILGSDFISQFVVELDYEKRVIKLHDRETFKYTGSGESISINLDTPGHAGHPIIDATVTPVDSDPITAKFLLDIGSGAALALHSPFVNKHGLIDPPRKTIKAVGGVGAGGETVGRIGRVSELAIGKYKISNPITMFSQDKAGAFASTTVSGNIGAQIASRFRLFFDYTNNRIILEPNASLSAPFDRAYGGVTVLAEGKDYRTFRVIDVMENSPASEAGLQKGDIISAVDGKPATEMTLTKLNEMLERPIPRKLTVLRGDQTLSVTLTPRQLV